jgi:acyl carrier protein
MATTSGPTESLQCPICGNATLAEFYEPAGATICPRCGFVFLRDSLKRFVAVEAERQAEFDALRKQVMEITNRAELDTFIKSLLNDNRADSLDLVELAMELEEAGVTVEDLKAGNVLTLEDLKRYIDEHIE